MQYISYILRCFFEISQETSHITAMAKKPKNIKSTSKAGIGLYATATTESHMVAVATACGIKAFLFFTGEQLFNTIVWAPCNQSFKRGGLK
jgi:hypothetical protein